MNVQQFIQKAQGYYGRYTPEQKSAVTQWLQQKPERVLPLIWAEVLKILSAVYKTPPGVFELEKSWREVKTRRFGNLHQTALPEPQGERMSEKEVAPFFEKLKEICKLKNLRRGSHDCAPQKREVD